MADWAWVDVLAADLALDELDRVTGLVEEGRALTAAGRVAVAHHAPDRLAQEQHAFRHALRLTGAGDQASAEAVIAGLKKLDRIARRARRAQRGSRGTV